DLLGGPEQVVIGLLVRLSGEIKGMMMYLLKENFANKVTTTFYGKKTENVLTLDEMDRSAICEMGNIMASAYVNAIAQLTGLFIDISVPAFCADMVGAIMSVPAVEFAEVSDKVIYIDDKFQVSDDEIRSNMILIPEMESLELLFSKLGVEI
ncbi:MAG: chemotaxis protein CheC, partial [Oscillospiraceae bacterium]|nr:chemotaxis protein CheC [Oscillospiraceae bacterium]